MADALDYVKICESCPPGDGWGPSVTTDTTLNGVPYAPFSKGDKLGRMADWTAEGKDRERGGRMQYNRSYRGAPLPSCRPRPRLLTGRCRPASLRRQPRRHLQRTPGRGRVDLFPRQQHQRLDQVEVRPRRRLHPRPRPAGRQR